VGIAGGGIILKVCNKSSKIYSSFRKAVSLFNGHTIQPVPYKSWVGRHVSKFHNRGTKTNNLQYADDTTMPAEYQENKVELAERVENGSKCAGFKLNIKKNREISTGGTSENL
jgi:hypothetical protein